MDGIGDLDDLKSASCWELANIIREKFWEQNHSGALKQVGITSAPHVYTITHDKISVKLEDWTTVRKWAIQLLGEEVTNGNHIKEITGFQLLYGKKVIFETGCSGPNLFTILDKIVKHNVQLSEAYTKMRDKKANKDGDIGKMVIAMIRKRMMTVNGARVEGNDKYLSIQLKKISLGVDCNENKICFSVSSAGIHVKHDVEFADPKFDPEAIPDWIVGRLERADQFMSSVPKTMISIWKGE